MPLALLTFVPCLDIAKHSCEDLSGKLFASLRGAGLAIYGNDDERGARRVELPAAKIVKELPEFN